MNQVVDEWLIPVATNLIAAALLLLLRPAGAFIKYLGLRGKSVLNGLQPLRREQNVALFKYSLLIGISLINIPLNGFFLWQKTCLPGAASRLEVVELVFMCAIVLYWTHGLVYKLRSYSASDYLH